MTRTSRLALAAALCLATAACAVLRDPTPTLDAFLAQPPAQADPMLRYEEHGAGPPIVLIHGLGASRFTWRYLVTPLSRHGRVIALDLKGFGDSPKPADKHYSVYDQAALVHALLHRLGLDDVTLVGHSFGGGVALAAALRLEAEGRLARLILIDTIAYEQALPGFMRLLKTPLLGTLSVHLLPARLQAQALLRHAFYDDARIDEAAVTAYAAGLKAPGGRYAVLQTARQIVPTDLDSLAARYEAIRAPTLILWGREDRVTPLEIGERLHRALENSRLVVLDDVGHMPQEEAPADALVHIAAFLEEHGVPPRRGAAARPVC